jgi:hypothetical protein
MWIKAQIQHCAGKGSGDLEWHSETGHLSGSLARQVLITIREALAQGEAGWGPQHCLGYPIKNSLHTPAEMAVILDLMGFIVPAELAAVYPEPTAEQLGYDEIDAMTPEERARLVF